MRMVDLSYGWGIGLEVQDSGEQEGTERAGNMVQVEQVEG